MKTAASQSLPARAFFASVGLHAAVFTTLLLMPSSPPQLPTTAQPLQVQIIRVPPPPSPEPPPSPKVVPVVKTPPQAHAPRSRPIPPKLVPIAKIAQATPVPSVAATATPLASPIPTPLPSSSAEEKLAVLRSIPDLKNLSDDDLRQLELPPGVKSWKDFAKLAIEIGMFKGAFPPPTTGQTGSESSASDSAAVPTWAWKEDKQQQEGQASYQEGTATITWRHGATHVQVSYKIPDPQVPPLVFTIAVGPASDRVAIAQAATRELPKWLGIPTPLPSPGASPTGP